MLLVGFCGHILTKKVFLRHRSTYIEIFLRLQYTIKTVLFRENINFRLKRLKPLSVLQSRRHNLPRLRHKSSTLVCFRGLTVETVVSVLSALARLVLSRADLNGYNTFSNAGQNLGGC